jgi:hypothetical protein
LLLDKDIQTIFGIMFNGGFCIFGRSSPGFVACTFYRISRDAKDFLPLGRLILAASIMKADDEAQAKSLAFQF